MKFLILPLIRFYKRFFSDGLNAGCKHTPTCSVYSMQAIDEWGAIIGGIMSIIRIISCNPFSSGGYKPVKRCKFKHRYTL
ncbi:MAG: membrane protein insertion efficiency factor YidD [Clostridia bacterium]|nr:membrane protein insertion efficiency factor YidD [Clostridia bacterium]MBR2324110.1 membrane protein insertion efficiency factor YidD [Clostridia bacterium]MBR2398036.1 membrane protein insertion efficiency factor YidD [Clostridia bacterium]MBR2874591.1 membrane protein insertion efficiency factor YidD [Clostridia bacterium]MBR6692993.1 membrane protein insertion efficiency factor YidD [Clostridia bacterium]